MIYLKPLRRGVGRIGAVACCAVLLTACVGAGVE